MRNFEPGLFITLFADASFCPHTKAAGFGGWVKYGSPAETFRTGGQIGNAKHSSDAEYQALIRTFKKLQEESAANFNDKIIVIQSDCRAALEKLERHKSKVFADIKPRHIKFKWVKAHQGYNNARSAVNEFCDTEAYRHMSKLRAKRNKAGAVA